MLKQKKGQSTVEYILLATAVIAVIIVFTTNKNIGMQQRLGDALNTATNSMGSLANRLDASHAGTNGTLGGGGSAPSITLDPGAGFNGTGN